MSNYLSYLPDERLQLGDFGGQADAEGDGVREAGDGAGDNGRSHGEGQHGVDNKHDEEEEGHLGAGNRETLISKGADLSQRYQTVAFLRSLNLSKQKASNNFAAF